MTFNHTEPSMLQCRQALESLRNGVPNRAAVELLGCNQREMESNFEDLLRKASDTENPPENTLGMLVSGDFGTGKSHLLSYMEHRALEENFVCSRVSISKETPLYKLDQVFTAAIQRARLGDRTGQLMEEIGDRVNSRNWNYDQFSRWVSSPESGLHDYFRATLLIYERSQDLDLNSEIEAFWAGGNIRVSRIREGLRSISQQRSFPNLRAARAADLSPQRLRFATELVKGVGYQGWVALIDEIELVGSYSLLQRANSYAELTRWLGKIPGEAYPGLIVVGAWTQGFESDVLGDLGKNDEIIAPNRLRERNRPELAAQAESGIRALNRETVALRPLDEEDITQTIEQLRLIHSKAYGWDAPEPTSKLGGAAYQNTIRYKVRACINEWDLRRLYPGQEPEIEGQAFEYSYAELPELEEEVKDDEP